MVTLDSEICKIQCKKLCKRLVSPPDNCSFGCAVYSGISQMDWLWVGKDLHRGFLRDFPTFLKAGHTVAAVIVAFLLN